MKPLFKTKRMLTATLLALVMVVAVGATLALMASTSNSVTNTFAAAQVETEIDEDLRNDNKIVTIENTGKSPVYVRARIMVSGVDPDNIVIADEPDEYIYNEDTDEYGIETPEAGKLYLIMPNVTEDWEQAAPAEPGKKPALDDYYYYKKVLPGKEEGGTTHSTSSLLEKVVVGSGLATQLKEDPNFSVTVYHESVLAIDTAEPITLEKVTTAFSNAKPTP